MVKVCNVQFNFCYCYVHLFTELAQSLNGGSHGIKKDEATQLPIEGACVRHVIMCYFHYDCSDIQ